MQPMYCKKCNEKAECYLNMLVFPNLLYEVVLWIPIS